MTVVANTRLFNTRTSLDYYTPIRDFSNNQFYIFAGNPIPLQANTPAAINDTVTFTDYTLFEQMIFGKIITPSNVSMMINRYDWTSGTVYANYDDQDSYLYNKNFYVISQEGGNYHVFKCLDNFDGSPSTSQPLFSQTSATAVTYVTSDGYTWKYMYTVDPATYSSFTTSSYFPVIANTVVQQFASNGSIDSIVIETGGNNYVSYSNGSFTGVALGGNTVLFSISAASSSPNNNFYTGSSLYISSGTGAGQVRQITNYTVTSGQYIVQVQSPFNPQPDLTSSYSIAPTVSILGDGSNATAISTVNTTAQSIQKITMITGGQNYTYANVQIIGNTGTLLANSANARAIISPKGGHGSNVYSELNSNKLGLSVTFANSENGNISTNNDYSVIGVIKNPQYANVQLTYNTLSGTFSVGESIIQYNGSVNTSQDTYTSLVRTFTYNNANYVTLTVANSSVFSVNTVVSQANTANGVVINISSNSVLIRQDSGAFIAPGTVVKNSNTLANTTFSGVTSGFSNYVFGLDSSNNLLSTNTTTTVSVAINGTNILNHSIVPSSTNAVNYSTNTTSIQFYNKTLSNTDTVTISEYITTAQLSNVVHTATGVLVSSNSTVINLTKVTGQFLANSSTIVGSKSQASAQVSAVTQPQTVINQTTRLSGSYNTGTLALNEYVQQGYPGNGGAYGYVQDIVSYSNGMVYEIALTGVKGQFVGNGYIQSANADAIFTVTAITNPDLVPYTGEIIYAQNIVPVSRSNKQNESVQLVIQFF